MSRAAENMSERYHWKVERYRFRTFRKWSDKIAHVTRNISGFFITCIMGFFFSILYYYFIYFILRQILLKKNMRSAAEFELQSPWSDAVVVRAEVF